MISEPFLIFNQNYPYEIVGIYAGTAPWVASHC